MIVVLAAMLGKLACQVVFGFGWHYNGAGTPGVKALFLVVSPGSR